MPEIQEMILKSEKCLDERDEDFKLIKKCYDSVYLIEKDEWLTSYCNLRDQIPFENDSESNLFLEELINIKLTNFKSNRNHLEKIFTRSNDDEFDLLCSCFSSITKLFIDQYGIYNDINNAFKILFKKLVKLKFNL